MFILRFAVNQSLWPDQRKTNTIKYVHEIKLLIRCSCSKQMPPNVVNLIET